MKIEEKCIEKLHRLDTDQDVFHNYCPELLAELLILRPLGYNRIVLELGSIVMRKRLRFGEDS